VVYANKILRFRRKKMKRFFKKICCLAVRSTVDQVEIDDAYGSSVQKTNAPISKYPFAKTFVGHFPGRCTVNSERCIVPSENVFTHQGQNKKDGEEVQTKMEDQPFYLDKKLIDSLAIELAESEKVNEILLQKLYEKEEKLLASEKLYSCWQKSLVENDEMEDYSLDLFFQPSEEEWYSNNQFEYQYGVRIAEEDPYENMSFEELYRSVYGDPVEVDTESVRR